MNQALQNLGLLALGTRLRVISEQMMGTVKSFYEDNGLGFEPRWFPLFRIVQARPGIGMMELAQAIGVSHVAVNAFCKQLMANNLITLTPDPNDARAKQLSLSPEGEVLYTRLEPAWFVLKEALQNVFPEDDATRLLATLSQLEEALDEKAIPRGLKSILKPANVLGTLKIVPYSHDNPDHKRYFTALNIEWLEQYFTVEPVDWQMFADPHATIIAKGGSIYMAQVGSQIVGTCALVKRSEDMYEMAKMAVSSLFQGKGIGTKLVAVILDHARSLGLKKLYLVSSVKLPYAVATYRKLGFVDSDLAIHDLYERADITLEKTL